MPQGTEMYSIAIWAIFLGIIFSIIYISMQKTSISLFIRKLIDNEAFDDNSANTLEQLGITNKITKSIIYRGIKTQHGLIRIIGFTSKEACKTPLEFSKTTPTDEFSFYLEKESAEDAKKKYTLKKSNKFYVAICIIVLFIIACLANTVISWLTSYAGSVFSNYGSYRPYDEGNSEQNVSDKADVNSDSGITDEQATNETYVKNNDIKEDENISNSDDNITFESPEETPSGPTIPKGPMS